MNDMIFPAVMVILGLLYIIFAVIVPPQWVQGFFKIPAIFIFLPERIARPVGSFLTGILLIGVGLYVATLMQ